MSGMKRNLDELECHYCDRFLALDSDAEQTTQWGIPIRVCADTQACKENRATNGQHRVQAINDLTGLGAL